MATVSKRKGSQLMNMKWEEFEEHATEHGKEAIEFLLELDEMTVELSDKQKAVRAAKLRSKTTKDGKQLYTDEAIEKQVNETRIKMPVMAQKIEYCKRFWQEMSPKEKSEISEHRQRLLEALEKSKKKR